MTYKRIRSLTRGLEVLRYLNTVKGAAATDIAEHVRLPRPTVHRILETLSELGLVYHSPSANEFRLATGVRRLAGVGAGKPWIDEIAAPSLHQLTANVIWPSDLALRDGCAMVIHEATHRVSPMSCDVGMVGRRRPMLLSPLGRAYLAHCPNQEREDILTALRNSEAPDDRIAHDHALVESIIADGRRDGVSSCPERPHLRCASLAAPIRHQGKVLACMNVVWSASALPFDEAIERLRPQLLAARDRIEVQLRRRSVQHDRAGATAPTA